VFLPPATLSTAHLTAVDVSKHVHNLPNTSHKPRRRKSTRFDDIGLDHIENTKDTSWGRVPTSQPAVDAPNRVHNAFHDSHNLTLRNTKCSDEICIGNHGNTKDTSPGRVPPLLPVVDVSDNSHNPMHQLLMRSDVHSVNLIENTKDMSYSLLQTCLYQPANHRCTETRLPSAHQPL